MSSDPSGPYFRYPGGPSYHEWLILKQQRQIALEASQGAAQPVLRSIEGLRGEIRETTDRIEKVIGDTARDINRSLDDISLSIGEFHADFDWHMDRVELKLEHVKAILSKLAEELFRRHRSEAFEFFEQSREYSEHGMFKKALQSVEIAIHGDERARGYELEWRFWEHLGILRLGRGNNAVTDDPAKAEVAFLQAARLATRTAPKAAAGCLVGAAYAAYADGRLATAIDHIRSALSQDSDLAEAHWNLGRYLWQTGKFQQAAEGFCRALSINPNYTKRFKNDMALQQPSVELQRLQANLIQVFRRQFDCN